MSIIEPGEVQKNVQDVVRTIKQNNQSLFNYINALHSSAFSLVWRNEDFTPAEILAAFGTDGLALFQLSWGLQQILKNADPSYELLVPPVETIVNEDGTVEIKPAVEEVIN